MATERYEVVVIGGGPGGYPAGIRLGQHGKKALLIERENLGGVCLNWGCIPSKAIIHAANVRHEVEAFGKVFSGVPLVSATELQVWKDGIIKKQRQGIAGLLKTNGCDHKKGDAKITGPHTLTLDGGNGSSDTIEFEQLILATGASIIEIPGFPFSDPVVGYARDAVAYDPFPRNLVIIGGGVIGSELGMAYAKLGSKVTIVEMLDSILPGNDKDLVRPVLKTMKKLGIEMYTKAKAKGFARVGAGAEVEVEIDGKSLKVPADKILVAVGFKPNTKNLGLEALGNPKLDARGWVVVDQECRTSVPHVFAVGDVTGPPLLAHRATTMGEVAAEVISGKPSAFDVMAMPLGTFTDPEMAVAGLTEQQALERGYQARSALFPISVLGRAGAMNQSEGVVKIVIDEKSDVVLGIGITAANACDLIAEACLAIEMGALAEDLALTVHVHPTLSEGLMEAAKAVRGEALHIMNKRPSEGARGQPQSAH